MQAWQRRMGFISRWASRPAPDSPTWFTGLQCGNPWFIAAEWRTRECCASNETPVPYYSHVCFTLSFTIYPQLFATSITAIFMRGRKVHIKWEYNLCEWKIFEYTVLYWETSFLISPSNVSLFILIIFLIWQLH